MAFLKVERMQSVQRMQIFQSVAKIYCSSFLKVVG